MDPDAAWHVARFQDLGVNEIREHHHRFELGGAVAQFVADIHIRAERHVMSVPFDARERQQADAFGLFDGLREQVAGQFFPTHRFHPF